MPDMHASTAMLNAAGLRGEFEKFAALFDVELQTAPGFDIAKFIQQVPTGGATLVNLNTVRGVPIMKPWDGDKVVESAIKGFWNIIECQKYEATEKIERRLYNADQLGLLPPKIAGLAGEAENHRLRMFAAAFEGNPSAAPSGTEAGLTDIGTQKCLDGHPLWSTIHPKFGGDTFANVVTDNLDFQPLYDAWVAMSLFSDELHNRVMGIMADTLMVHPHNKGKAERLLKSEKLPGKSVNDANPIQNLVEVVVNPYLKNPNFWALVDSKRGMMKPVIDVVNVPAHLVPYIDPQSWPVFSRGDFLYSAEGDYWMKPGHPFTCFAGGFSPDE
jgi:phage major head subunit gpT-like protein